MPVSSSASGPNALDVVAGLTNAISRAADLDHIYTAALDGLNHGLGVERASILLFDSDGVMRFTAWRGLSTAYRAAVEGHSPWRPDSTGAHVLGTSDVTADPDLAPFLPVLRAEDIGALAFVPLVSRGRVIGKLMCCYRAAHELTSGEAVLAQTIADQVAFAVERTRNEEALLENEKRLRFALDAATMGTWDWDLRTDRVEWSEQVDRIHGLAPGTFGGDRRTLERLIHPADRERVFESVRRAIRDGSIHDVEYRVVSSGGLTHWVESKGRVEFDAAGAPVRMAGVSMLIGRRKQAELDRAALVARTALLAEVSALLSRSLDYERTLQALAEFAVTHLADCCIVDVCRDDGRIEAAGLACANPGLLEEFGDLRRRFPPRVDDAYRPRGRHPERRARVRVRGARRRAVGRRHPGAACANRVYRLDERDPRADSPRQRRRRRADTAGRATVAARLRERISTPLSRSRAGRALPSKTRGSIAPRKRPTGQRTTSWPPCRTSCARRSTRFSAGPA